MEITELRSSLATQKQALEQILKTCLIRWDEDPDATPTPEMMYKKLIQIRDRSVIVTKALSIIKPIQTEINLAIFETEAQRKSIVRDALENDPSVKRGTSAEERKSRAEVIGDRATSDTMEIYRRLKAEADPIAETLELVYRDIDNARRDLNTISYVWQTATKLESN